jgi:hypothetical protein
MKKSARFLLPAALFTGLVLCVSTQSTNAQETHWAIDPSGGSALGSGGFDFNNGPVIASWDNFANFGDLIMTADFNNLSFNNTGVGLGNTIQPWGLATDFDTATYGETFIDPAGTTTLNDFTFYIEGDAGYTFSYQPFVMTWSGTLFGGGSVDESGSSIIYASNPVTYLGDGSMTAVEAVIGGGGLTLTPGDSYLIGFTTLGADVVVPTGPGVSAPDAASSALLLSFAIGGLAVLRRRFGLI